MLNNSSSFFLQHSQITIRSYKRTEITTRSTDQIKQTTTQARSTSASSPASAAEALKTRTSGWRTVRCNGCRRDDGAKRTTPGDVKVQRTSSPVIEEEPPRVRLRHWLGTAWPAQPGQVCAGLAQVLQPHMFVHLHRMSSAQVGSRL
jgi:hypothetical protein